MQLLLEFFPLIAFVIAYKFLGGIYVATVTLMAAMLLSLGITWLRTRKIPPLLGASTVLVLLFGAATLVLRDVRFIQWKPSIFLWLLALAFLGSAFIGRQTLAQRVLQPALGDDVKLERADWLKLNAAWVVYGIVFGLINLFVVYNASEATWVNVKVYGLTGSLFLFTIGQFLWLSSRGKLPS
jgi:intracellular septation protein